MEKKPITRKEFKFLEEEINYCSTKGLLSDEQKIQILSSYEIGRKLNFIRVLVTIGAILIGLGILSFIASNWSTLGKVSKLLIIIGSFIGTNSIAYILEGQLPKTSRSLNYLGILIYGAGIFLIGQMFHFGGHFTNAFLLWSLGTLPIALLLQDKAMFIFTVILSLIYLNGHVDFVRDIRFPFYMLFTLPVFYYAGYRYFKNANIITFFNNIVALNFIIYTMNYWNFNGISITIVSFIIGLIMYFYPFPFSKGVFQLQGNIVFGISGVILTISHVWKSLSFVKTHATAVSIIFAIGFLFFLLLLTRKENLISLIFICIIIFRYYIDTMYDFMPKSLFFIIGGLILLGFGYYFERMRRKRSYSPGIAEGGIVDEK